MSSPRASTPPSATPASSSSAVACSMSSISISSPSSRGSAIRVIQLAANCRHVPPLSPPLRDVGRNRPRRPPQLIGQRIPLIRRKTFRKLKHPHRQRHCILPNLQLLISRSHSHSALPLF